MVEQRLTKRDEVRKLIYRLLLRKRWREEIGEKGVGVWERFYAASAESSAESSEIVCASSVASSVTSSSVSLSISAFDR